MSLYRSRQSRDSLFDSIKGTLWTPQIIGAYTLSGVVGFIAVATAVCTLLIGLNVIPIKNMVTELPEFTNNYYINGSSTNITIPTPTTAGTGLSLIASASSYIWRSFGDGYGTIANVVSDTLRIDLNLVAGYGINIANNAGQLTLSVLSSAVGVMDIYVVGIITKSGNSTHVYLTVPAPTDSASGTGSSVIADGATNEFKTLVGQGGLIVNEDGGNVYLDASAISGGGSITDVLASGTLTATNFNATVKSIYNPPITSAGAGSSWVKTPATNVIYSFSCINGLTCPLVGDVYTFDGAGLSGSNATLVTQVFPIGSGVALVNGSNTVKSVAVSSGITATDEGSQVRLGLSLARGSGIGGSGNNVTNTGVLSTLSAEIAYGAPGLGLLATQGTGNVVTKTITTNSYISYAASDINTINLAGSGVQQGPTGLSPIATSGVSSMGTSIALFQSDISPGVSAGTYFRWDMTFQFVMTFSSVFYLDYTSIYPVSGPIGFLISPVLCYDLTGLNAGKTVAGIASFYDANTIRINVNFVPANSADGDTFRCTMQLSHYTY